MAKVETTAEKRNAYDIRGRISQAIFKEFISAQSNECFRYTQFANYDRPSLSALASIATRSIMNNPHLNVILRKY